MTWRARPFALVLFACSCATADDVDPGVPRVDASPASDAPDGVLDASRDSSPATRPDTAHAETKGEDVGGDVARDSPAPPVDTTAARCGDGRIDPGEVCDDGGTASGDGCSADCTSVECDSGRVFEDPATHHCYRRSTEVVSRSSAQAKCASDGGYLARLTTAAERDAAYPAMISGGTDKVWIGLQKVAGVPTWDDGTVADAAALKWGSGEPSGDGDCIEWRSGNELNDLGCSGHSRDFVCEREPKGTK